MADAFVEGYCPICKGAIITDEVFVACDWRGWSTGDYAEDIYDGTPQSHVGHPRCVKKVAADPETV